MIIYLWIYCLLSVNLIFTLFPEHGLVLVLPSHLWNKWLNEHDHVMWCGIKSPALQAAFSSQSLVKPSALPRKHICLCHSYCSGHVFFIILLLFGICTYTLNTNPSCYEYWLKTTHSWYLHQRRKLPWLLNADLTYCWEQRESKDI